MGLIRLVHINWVRSENITSTHSARIPLCLFDHYPPRQRALNYIMTQLLNKKGGGTWERLIALLTKRMKTEISLTNGEKRDVVPLRKFYSHRFWWSNLMKIMVCICVAGGTVRSASPPRISYGGKLDGWGLRPISLVVNKMGFMGFFSLSNNCYGS